MKVIKYAPLYASLFIDKIKEVLMSSILTSNLHESSKKIIALLDLKVCYKNSKIITDLSAKSTDHHQYPSYLCAHPNYTK